MTPMAIVRLIQMISRHRYGISEIDTPGSGDFDSEV